MRSATYCLGVVQALARRDILQDVDYMSTVSAGGYLGASITGLCADGPGESDPPGSSPTRLGVTRDTFPYRFPGPIEPTPFDRADPDATPVHGLESPATRHVREHANLLVRSPGIFDTETWTGLMRYVLSTASL
jgi:hypothetical protein